MVYVLLNFYLTYTTHTQYPPLSRVAYNKECSWMRHTCHILKTSSKSYGNMRYDWVLYSNSWELAWANRVKEA